MDCSEVPEKMFCSDRTSSISPCVNILYSLRSRTIFDCEKCEGHVLDKNVSGLQESAVLRKGYSAQTRYSIRNIPTEDVAGRPSRKVNSFNKQLQSSQYVTHSVNDRFVGTPPVMKLSDEVLITIFKHLDVFELSTSVAPVCKRWYAVAHSPVLWRKLRFNGDEISTENAKSLLTKSPCLLELTISNR